MPLKRCQQNNKQGWKWGDEGKCYTYNPNSEASEKRAKSLAVKQGFAIDREEARRVLNNINNS